MTTDFEIARTHTVHLVNPDARLSVFPCIPVSRTISFSAAKEVHLEEVENNSRACARVRVRYVLQKLNAKHTCHLVTPSYSHMHVQFIIIFIWSFFATFAFYDEMPSK